MMRIADLEKKPLKRQKADYRKTQLIRHCKNAVLPKRI